MKIPALTIGTGKGRPAVRLEMASAFTFAITLLILIAGCYSYFIKEGAEVLSGDTLAFLLMMMIYLLPIVLPVFAVTGLIEYYIKKRRVNFLHGSIANGLRAAGFEETEEEGELFLMRLSPKGAIQVGLFREATQSFVTRIFGDLRIAVFIEPLYLPDDPNTLDAQRYRRIESEISLPFGADVRLYENFIHISMEYFPWTGLRAVEKQLDYATEIIEKYDLRPATTGMH